MWLRTTNGNNDKKKIGITLLRWRDFIIGGLSIILILTLVLRLISYLLSPADFLIGCQWVIWPEIIMKEGKQSIIFTLQTLNHYGQTARPKDIQPKTFVWSSGKGRRDLFLIVSVLSFLQTIIAQRSPTYYLMRWLEWKEKKEGNISMQFMICGINMFTMPFHSYTIMNALLRYQSILLTDL